MSSFILIEMNLKNENIDSKIVALIANVKCHWMSKKINLNLSSFARMKFKLFILLAWSILTFSNNFEKPSHSVKSKYLAQHKK